MRSERGDALAVFGAIMASLVTVALIAVVVVGSTIGYYKILPWFYGQEFKAIRKSNPYVTTQQTSLVTLYAGYQKAKAAGQDAQAEAILLQIRQQASLIDKDQIPPEIARLLETTR